MDFGRVTSSPENTSGGAAGAQGSSVSFPGRGNLLSVPSSLPPRLRGVVILGLEKRNFLPAAYRGKQGSSGAWELLSGCFGVAGTWDTHGNAFWGREGSAGFTPTPPLSCWDFPACTKS